MVVAVLIFGLVGNDFATEGNWTWDGKNQGNGKQFWNGNFFGTAENNFVVNWGTDFFGFQMEPDDFLGSQDALAMSVDGWPLGARRGME